MIVKSMMAGSDTRILLRQNFVLDDELGFSVDADFLILSLDRPASVRKGADPLLVPDYDVLLSEQLYAIDPIGAAD